MVALIRTRKFEHGSDSSDGFDPASGAYTIEYYVACKDPFRVGPANKNPMPWPYLGWRASDEARRIARELEEAYTEILQQHGIRLRSTRVASIWSEDYNRRRETLIMMTDDENPVFWGAAATAVQNLLDQATEKRHPSFRMRAEIRNPHRMYRDTSSAIQPNTMIHQACLEVEEAVYEAVKSYCPGQWSSISYFMRGPREQYENLHPTVVITINPGTRSLWDYISHQISDVIKSASTLDVELYLEILPGRVQPFISSDIMPSMPIDFADLPRYPTNSASIGPRGTNEAGTFGMFVDFQTRGETGKQRCCLTCYHLVGPGDPANQELNDERGIGLHGRSDGMQIIVDYPAPVDSNSTILRLQKDIANGNDSAGIMGRTIDTIGLYKSSGGIGSVIHGSGRFRLNNDGRKMDWALIQLNGSIPPQPNRPPRRSSLTERDFWGQIYTDEPTAVISQVATPKEGDWVAKVGRTTGTTPGEINAILSRVVWTGGRETRELTVASLRPGNAFAEPGDSGAMVTNIHKEWVGMLMGACLPHEEGYITPAIALMEDIKATTGGSISIV